MGTKTCISCEPCQTRNIDRVAVCYCMECEESLCSSCISGHNSFKGLKNHLIMDIKYKDSCSVFKMKCEIHHKNPEYFCSYHDELFCQDCLTERHETCTNKVPIESASYGVRESITFLDCIDRLEYISKTYKKIADDRHKATIEMVINGQDINETFKSMTDQIISKITQLQKKFCKEVNQKSEVITSDLRSQELEAFRCKGKNDMQLKAVRSIRNQGSNSQVFLMVHQMNKYLQKYENELQKKVSELKNTSLTFKINDNIFKAFDSLGEFIIFVEETSCDITYNHPNVQQAQSPV